MSKDVLFRTVAFGGFKKDEVMDFIGKILAEKSELERQLAANTARNTQLENQVAQLMNDVEDTARLRTELLEAKSEIDSLHSLIEEKDELITELTRRASKSDAVESLEAELQALRAENLRLKEENERKRDMERQVGAAMLDARAHSEELVAAAKERAGIVTREAYTSIGEAALEIDNLSLAIGEIARSFAKSVEEVELRVKVLTGDMSKVAQTLISDGSTASDSSVPEYDFSSPVTHTEVVFDDCEDSDE